MKRLTMVFLLVLSQCVFGFFPPLPTLIQDVYENRNKTTRTLFLFVHHLKGSQGNYQIEEQVLEEKGKIYSLWKTNGYTMSSLLEAQTYQFGKEKLIPARSALFINYYVNPSEEKFLDLLVDEEFARKETFQQIKSNAPPTGWNLKDYYIRPESITLARLPQGEAIASRNGTQRALYIAKNRKSLVRIEWNEGGQLNYWDFGPATRFSYGEFPRTARFIKNQEEWFVSEFQGIRNLNERSLAEWKNTWKTSFSRNNPEAVPHLKQFLSFR